jgi:hypothetical protein
MKPARAGNVISPAIVNEKPVKKSPLLKVSKSLKMLNLF